MAMRGNLASLAPCRDHTDGTVSAPLNREDKLHRLLTPSIRRTCLKANRAVHELACKPFDCRLAHVAHRPHCQP
jgi:hypothetical protein